MNRKKDIYKVYMSENTKRLADRLIDEGFCECISDALVNRLTRISGI